MEPPLRIRRPSAPEPGANDGSAAPSRDLHAARQAYETGDAEGSRRAHAASAAFSVDAFVTDSRLNKAAGDVTLTHASPPAPPCEPGHDKHSCAYTTLASSFLDGVFLSTALIAVSSQRPDALPLLVAAAVALSLSQGVRSYMRARADGEHFDRERARESWELRNYFEGEVAEMVEMYARSGVALEDARTAIAALAKYPSFFVDMMMVQELGLIKPDTAPAVIGVAASAGVMLGTALPVLLVHALAAAAFRLVGGSASFTDRVAAALRLDAGGIVFTLTALLVVAAAAVIGVRAFTRVRVGVHVWMYVAAGVGITAPALLAMATMQWVQTVVG